MKALKITFSLILLLNISVLCAQNIKLHPRSTIMIESGEGSNKKSCLGYFYSFVLTKENAYYGSILVNKAVVNNSSEIKLFFEREDYGMTSAPKDPQILALPIKSIEIIQDNDPSTELVAIRYGQIRELMQEKDIYFDPVFFDEEYLLDVRVRTPLKESDLSKLKAIWEKQLEEWEMNHKQSK